MVDDFPGLGHDSSVAYPGGKGCQHPGPTLKGGEKKSQKNAQTFVKNRFAKMQMAVSSAKFTEKLIITSS
jgi:hypothetical protein